MNGFLSSLLYFSFQHQAGKMYSAPGFPYDIKNKIACDNITPAFRFLYFNFWLPCKLNNITAHEVQYRQAGKIQRIFSGGR